MCMAAKVAHYCSMFLMISIWAPAGTQSEARYATGMLLNSPRTDLQDVRHATVLHNSFNETEKFHIEGTIDSPWDSVFRGVLIPRKQLIFDGVQAITTVKTDDNDSYVVAPKTEVTFKSEHENKTVVVNEKGFYSADLPVGLYKMTAKGPTIGTQALTPYIRLFRVASSDKIVVNGKLYMARTNCDALPGGRTGEEAAEELKNICGGTDLFPVATKDGTVLQLYIRYPQRQVNDPADLYTIDQLAEPDVPVFLAYNLFSVEAESIAYVKSSKKIVASGKVLTSDGSGKVRHFDYMQFTIDDSRLIPSESFQH